MDPITWAAIAAIVAAGAGFGAGWGLKPDASVKALEAQTESIEAMAEGNKDLVVEVQKVALAEAEKEAAIADKLTDVPPPCLSEIGGNPMSLQCSWALCIRTGETDKQRCEPSKLTDALIAEYASKSCPEVP